MLQWRILSLLVVILVISSCLTSFKENNHAPQTQMIYPGSDEIELAAFTKSVFPNETTRKPATKTLNLPKNYFAGKLFPVITDPSILQEIERRGYTFAFHLENQNKETTLNSELVKNSPRYSSIVEVIEGDLKDLTAAERAKRGQNSVGVGIRKYPYRIFDSNWLRSRISNFQLIGIMNRLDRVAFNPDSCGELRLVYRLGYDQGPKGIQSRLPLTLMVKYTVPGKAYPNSEWNLCKRMVRNWTYPDIHNDPQALVDWMTSEEGPLASAYLRPENLQSVELNMQAFRIPSSMRPELGGHGSYLMRVFKPEGSRLIPSKLENTPDVEKILNNKDLLARLKAMMKDRHVINRLDAGILKLDDAFLTDRAYSYSPLGLSRKDNRLFNKLLSDSDFDPNLFVQNMFVKTPDAAIRRLNDLSCVGCHQGRATAGFHFLGIDREDTHAFNALHFEGSGHFQLELIRRNAYMERVSKNLAPDPNRDFSFAPPLGRKAEQGHFCGLNSSFAHWKCAEGLECMQIDGVKGDIALGKCFAKALPAGAPCAVGVVSQKEQYSDAIELTKTLTCGDGRKHYGCSAVKGGFPSGMCNTNCSNLNSLEICAQIAGGGFTECVATGKPFEKCLDGSAMSGRGVCNDDLSCRNDYVCARTAGSKNGNCTPSYFLFQIRLDGHPDPI